MRAASLLRHSRWDAVLIAGSLAHGAVLAGLWTGALATNDILLLGPATVGAGMWWTANTVAHNFIHLPFFSSRSMNAVYSAYLSLLMGLPQRLWRARHLAHHAGAHHVHVWWTRGLAMEVVLVVALWSAWLFASPRESLFVYAPGFLIGLSLCAAQGHYEHHRGTTSHYGRLYNVLFFNDGYHVEHHAAPARHWRALPAARADKRRSPWPPVLRWLDDLPRDVAGWLSVLERVVLRSPTLQEFVLSCHERAMRACLAGRPWPDRAVIVGGGLFPRTAIALRRIAPTVQLTLVDANEAHLRAGIALRPPGVTTHHAVFEPAHASGADLLVIPLAFVGDRRAIYTSPPAPVVFVHDWIWARRAPGVRVSWLLLKRLNVVHARRAGDENGRRA